MNSFASPFTLALVLALGMVSMSHGQPQCPTGFRYVALRQQCLPTKVRLLPLRSLVVAAGASSSSSTLLDKRPDTYVTASAARATVLRANFGKKYTVTKIRVDYQNSSGQPVVLKVLDASGAAVGTGTLSATGQQSSVTIALLKTVGTRKKIPVGQAFRIQIPKAASGGGAVRVSDVSFFGGSDPSNVIPGGKISWGLAVVVDFTNGKLEDYTQDALAINNVLDLRAILNQMESHFRYVSQDKHQVEWAIQRIQLDAAYAPNAYDNDWVKFRDALAAKLLTKVSIADYDTNADGALDHAWFVLANKGVDGGDPYFFSIGGRSMHLGVDMFVDGQGAFAVKDNCIGCFNHEVGHTDAVGRGDIYGALNNLGPTSIMSYPWGANPGGFLAVELMELGWIDVLRITSDSTNVCLSPMEVKSSPFSYKAVVIETGDPDEFFMAEYRKRPTSGWGSGWNFAADGILITHVLKSGSNGAGPNPYIRIEPADGSLPYGEWPNEADLWDEADEGFDGTLYDGTPIFTASNFVRPTDGTMCFDVSFL